MPQKISNVNEGVHVKISPCNARKVAQVIKRTKRTFATEVNVAVEEHAERLRKLRGHRPPE